ncbi:MAG TPA: hypothetical protein ENJ32_01590 [Crenotrichaceae bacterium]|nr:hypothetical protein [Crenotrichaceae bacterium]
MLIESESENLVICEIIGLAGVGKSSVLAELQNRNLGNVNVSLSRLSSWTLKLVALLKVLPIYFIILFNRKIKNRPDYAVHRIKQAALFLELRVMIYLQLGIDLLSQDEIVHKNRALIFDQGPVFKLATLYLFGSTQYSPTAMRWWENMADAWAAHITHYVSLTAGVPVLQKRVYNRESNHTLKELSDKEANHFISDYIKTFDLLKEKYFNRQEIVHTTIDTEIHDLKTVTSKVTEVILTANKIQTV